MTDAAEPRYRLGHRLGESILANIVEAYRQGESSRSLSVRFGIARNTVDELARQAGLPRHVTRMTDAEQTKAIRLYESGQSLQRVGNQLGRSPGTIWLLLKRRGVELRTQQGNRRKVG